MSVHYMYVTGKKPKMKVRINKIVDALQKLLLEVEDLKKEVDEL